ncbi:unnamed protein product [Allacma fusca]|uniref:Beta-Casp domain-containing protein n=1 Tax=Allacma fusca TaxID=39272 RepID=A0A8J2J193_9HEXA|nr:unnamed protein product [Allacma fusca]
MKFYNVGTPAKPCGILKWRGLTIMLDCSLDITTILNFLPLPLAGSSKFNFAPHFQNFRNAVEKELCEVNGSVLVDSTPLFGVPTESSVDISEIDVILVSNSFSILALPFFTEHPNFHGSVYATEPTVNIGRFFMEELVEFIEKVPRNSSRMSKDVSNPNDNGKENNIFKQLNPTLNFPIKLGSSNFNKDLREIYSRKSINDALVKLRLVGFNENLDLFGSIIATAISSGYSLGSCNWVLKSDKKKVVYVTSSSTLTTHPSPMEQGSLKDADIFFLTGLTKSPNHNPDSMMGEVCLTVGMTLKNGGNVVLPCYPSGLIYDLFECLANYLDANSLVSIPFYFLSPHAESSLAYSNILAEWLSKNKQKKVYLPEDPFPHAQLVKDGRIRHFKSLQDIKDLRQPCILFCGHPSLRCGDIVHIIETWGAQQAHALIITESEFPYVECISPYLPLSMKIQYSPIDTSLNFQQANKLIKELKPTRLVTHADYLVPPKEFPDKTEFTIDYPNIDTFAANSVVSLKLKRDGVSAVMDHLLAQEVEPNARNGAEVLASTITATLDNSDNKYRLLKPSMDMCNPWKCPPSKYKWGSLDATTLLNKFTKEGFLQLKLQNSPTGFVLANDTLTITVEGTSTHVVCGGGDDGATRLKVRRILSSCLQEL